MGVLRYRCPTTRSDVQTAIETRNDVLLRMKAMDLSIWAWCPHCRSGHQLKPADVKLEDDFIPLKSPLLKAS